MDSHGYRVIGDMKKDIHRMVDNALAFNKAKSQVHSDALRIRAAIDGYGNVGVRTAVESAVQATPSRASARAGGGKNPLLVREAQLRILEDLMVLIDEK